MKYTDKSGKGTHINLYHESACSTYWQYVCVNLNDLASNTPDLWNNRQTGSLMYVKDIYISEEVMVDDVWIGSTPLSGNCSVIDDFSFQCAGTRRVPPTNFSGERGGRGLWFMLK